MHHINFNYQTMGKECNHVKSAQKSLNTLKVYQSPVDYFSYKKCISPLIAKTKKNLDVI